MGNDATYSLEDFGIPYECVLGRSDFNIPIELIPKQYIQGAIYVNKKLRCTIEYGRKVNRGGYGSIYRCKRSGKEMCVKAPHNSAYSLCPEAILQWVACQTLEEAGIAGAIPHIYDIFQYAGETRFSMDFIHGMNAIDAINAGDSGMILQILAQVAILLGYLEEHIHLDHRDLKADNLWIRQTPIEYFVTVGGLKWRLSAPFQVVILDFGFACIGGEDGKAIISLSDGIVPKIDPCPKEGRDLFQLIASIWSIDKIRSTVSDPVRIQIEELLSYNRASYIDIIRHTPNPYWIYLAVSDPEFRYPPLHPVALLLKLSQGGAAGLYHE